MKSLELFLFRRLSEIRGCWEQESRRGEQESLLCRTKRMDGPRGHLTMLDTCSRCGNALLWWRSRSGLRICMRCYPDAWDALAVLAKYEGAHASHAVQRWRHHLEHPRQDDRDDANSPRRGSYRGMVTIV